MQNQFRQKEGEGERKSLSQFYSIAVVVVRIFLIVSVQQKTALTEMTQELVQVKLRSFSTTRKQSNETKEIRLQGIAIRNNQIPGIKLRKLTCPINDQRLESLPSHKHDCFPVLPEPRSKISQ
jgi:hypothetical protein